MMNTSNSTNKDLQSLLPRITPYLFFTGKGGVGKTSLACATAITLADSGKKVLLICTDPASNLRDVLESEVTEKIAPVNGIPNLHAVNIDPELAADRYRNRVISPLEDILPQHEIDRIREELSGGCTTEIAAFDEFARYVAGDGVSMPYEAVIFDTAPTGHTLRLLELPAAWGDFIGQNPDGASCIGPSSALQTSKQRYDRVVERLRDPGMTTVYLVTRPEPSALKEAARTSSELDEMGLRNQHLLVNGYFRPNGTTDPLATRLGELADASMAAMPEVLQKLGQTVFPLRPWNLLGAEKLRRVFSTEDGNGNGAVKGDVDGIGNTDADADTDAETGTGQGRMSRLPGLDTLLDDLTRNRENGLVLTMGKGGVGKTTIAAAIAMGLASRGIPVHLTTTDPAGHIEDLFDAGHLPGNLSLSRIDPKREKEQYIERVIRQKGESLDEDGRKLLREDLESPCTEEVAVYQAFSKAIHEARRKFVVVDTAPTGHTLLLLDTTGSYHRDVLRNSKADASRIKTPWMYLQDPAFASLYIVTLPETTPVSEAAKLQDDLRRAGIEPTGWIMNQSLSAVGGLSDPLLLSRAGAELPILGRVESELAQRLYSIPNIADENVTGKLASALSSAGNPVTPA